MTEPKFKRGDKVDIINSSHASFRVIGAIYDPSDECYFYALTFINRSGWNVFTTLVDEAALTYSNSYPFDGPKVIS